jgi:hypothetical protein
MLLRQQLQNASKGCTTQKIRTCCTHTNNTSKGSPGKSSISVFSEANDKRRGKGVLNLLVDLLPMHRSQKRTVSAGDFLKSNETSLFRVVLVYTVGSDSGLPLLDSTSHCLSLDALACPSGLGSDSVLCIGSQREKRQAARRDCVHFPGLDSNSTQCAGILIR